jgi:hypothetical protein
MARAEVEVVKVFSATKARDREELGDRVSAWIRANHALYVSRAIVLQSSDRQFHCLSIVLICRGQRG